MDFLLSGTKKVASLIRHVITGAGFLYVGLKIGSQTEVDGLMSAVNVVVTNVDTILTSALAISATVAGMVSKSKKWLGVE